MKSQIVRWFGAALAVGALTFAGAAPSYASEGAATRYAVPAEGVSNTQFMFQASGFQGASSRDEDKADASGEQVSYWINTPDGKVISTKPLSKPDNYDRTTEPLLDRADADGKVTVFWTAPSNALTGGYTIVIHGHVSNYESVIPFTIIPDGSQTVVQTNVTPASGPVGTTFTFRATGFKGAASDNGEQVSYWINTPDGKVISTEPLDETSNNGSDTTPLLSDADADGNVKIFWTAPAESVPGSYSLVVHGLSSQYQVVIPFTIE